MNPFHRLGILDTEPLIIRASTLWHVMNPVWEIGHHLKGHKTYFLLNLSWSLLHGDRFKVLMACYALYRQAFPEHEMIFLCNEEPEMKLLTKFNIPAVFAPHNALIDYNLFQIHENEEKIYDGIMNSRLDSFKRHILARKLDSMALITYYTPVGGKSRAERYLSYLRRNMPNCNFLNFDDQGDYRYLDKQEIALAVSQSHTGLIFSDVEGGCMAACEFLLAGIPVVSTTNQGGRDLFLPPEHSRTIEPTFDNAKKAVEELKSEQIDPYEIREECIRRITGYRQNFIDAWQMIYDLEGIQKNARELFEKQYYHLMAKNIYVDDIIKLFESIKNNEFEYDSATQPMIYYDQLFQ